MKYVAKIINGFKVALSILTNNKSQTYIKVHQKIFSLLVHLQNAFEMIV